MRECIVTYSNLHVNHPKEMTGIPYRTKEKSKDNTRLPTLKIIFPQTEANSSNISFIITLHQ